MDGLRKKIKGKKQKDLGQLLQLQDFINTLKGQNVETRVAGRENGTSEILEVNSLNLKRKITTEAKRILQERIKDDFFEQMEELIFLFKKDLLNKSEQFAFSFNSYGFKKNAGEGPFSRPHIYPDHYSSRNVETKMYDDDSPHDSVEYDDPDLERKRKRLEKEDNTNKNKNKNK